jgi:hypothetical protein
MTARNGATAGSFSPMGMNPGYVFFEGNNPLSSGRSAVYPPIVGELKDEIPEHPDNPHLTYRLLASRELGRPLEPAESNRYWRSMALNYIADHPWRFLSLLGSKAVAVVQNHRRHDLIPARRFDERLGERGVPSVPFALLVALSALGLAVSRHRWRQLVPLYAILATALLVMLVMYVSERQRLPALPALVIFALLGVESLLRTSRRAAIVKVVSALAFAWVLMLPSSLTREDDHLWAAHALSNEARDRAFQLRDSGQLPEAKSAAAASYARAP